MQRFQQALWYSKIRILTSAAGHWHADLTCRSHVAYLAIGEGLQKVITRSLANHNAISASYITPRLVS